MYVVRLKSVDGIVNFRAFRSRTLALSHFELGRSQVIDEILDESTLFDVISASDPRTAIRLVRDGRVALSRIYPRPMTQAQAAAWLADLNL
ncbi:MAG: hypothetical protein E7813_21100 [Bradyrhizobium sp.]|uniref:hypothetical protein n=1 Tax=Bradyrhizobium sp. TaxID=376 RepID=UPI001222C1FF|nr:hypothetical protein [Bradyrhizobium sp.]THD61935.1 MAG: hypothetical protein E7813_21100 [Bradyrhizobium sp.]